jgi:hypothetical protein
MDLNEVVSNYNAELRRLKEDMSQRFQNELKNAFQEVFTAYPNVRLIGWTQYTPYFNDGDPCVFSVKNLHVFDETVEEDAEDLYAGVDIYWGDGPKNYPLIAALALTLSGAEDLLLEMFGDHCKIVVTPSGIDVEEYEHV